MNDVQTNRVYSLIKSSDFLNDNAGDIAVITQLPPLALDLISIIDNIETAAAKGSLDLSGVAEQKSITRQKLIATMLKVARGGAAYYLSSDKLRELRIVDFTENDLNYKRDNDLYATAKELHQMAVADGANYIGVSITDITLLDTEKEKFFDYIQDPKREIEIAAQHNALIDPLITQGMELRKKMDIYMQTFIATNPIFYNEWKASLSIDDTGANTPPSYTLTLSIAAGSIQNVDYSAVALQGNTDIKLINDSAGALIYGFGNDDTTFSSTDTVNANTQKRKSAISLGYDALTDTKLNIQNANGVDLSCTLEFYEMG